MNKRIILVASVILVAVLSIGIGFAAVGDTLQVGGTATVSANDAAFDANIKFTTAEVAVANAANSVVLSENDDTATLVCGSLAAKDDSATFNFVVTNSGDLDATVTAALSAIENNDGYFEVTHTCPASSTVTANGGTLEFTVTVKLLRTPAIDKSATFTLTLGASAE